MDKENIILTIIYAIIAVIAMVDNMYGVMGVAMFWTGYFFHKGLYGEE